MSRDEISSLGTALSDLLAVPRAADPADKAQIYSQLGLRLTCQPSDDPAVRAQVGIVSARHWQFEGFRWDTVPPR
jgi:site-specific DNA recombinase